MLSLLFKRKYTALAVKFKVNFAYFARLFVSLLFKRKYTALAVKFKVNFAYFARLSYLCVSSENTLHLYVVFSHKQQADVCNCCFTYYNKEQKF